MRNNYIGNRILLICFYELCLLEVNKQQMAIITIRIRILNKKISFTNQPFCSTFNCTRSEFFQIQINWNYYQGIINYFCGSSSMEISKSLVFCHLIKVFL